MNDLVLLAAVALTAATIRADIEEDAGELIRRGTYLGRVAVVNQQKVIPLADIQSVTKVFADLTQCNIAVVSDRGDAALCLTVIDDPSTPLVLFAAEDHWATLNVGKLKKNGANAGQLKARARKLLIKTLSLLCGGASSSFPGNLMNTASVRELDGLPEQIPVDMQDKYRQYLAKLGVTPKDVVSYREACIGGWAPSPTNDAQKAIWNEVHAIPQTPMKIEFDPKKGR